MNTMGALVTKELFRLNTDLRSKTTPTFARPLPRVLWALDGGEANIVDWNRVAQTTFGWAKEETLGRNFFELLKIPQESETLRHLLDISPENGAPLKFHSCCEIRSGETILVRWINTIESDRHSDRLLVTSIGEDITEGCLSEAAQNLIIVILKILTEHRRDTDKIRKIIDCLKEHSGCQSVGLLLKKGDRSPLYETIRASEEFGDDDGALCLHAPARIFEHDKKGVPGVQCICGKIAKGQSECSSHFFTEGGSFWVNSSSDFLSYLGQEDPRARRQHNCIRSGFESMARIPLFSEERLIGILQLNDCRKNRFDLKTIRIFEAIAASIGMALEHEHAESQLREKEAHLLHVSQHDTLTKLPNRFLLHNHLQQVLQRLKQVSLLLINLDRFKRINDALGHDIGDRILCLVARKLKNLFKESAFVARWGGDEFVIVLESTSEADVELIVQKILHDLTLPMAVDRNDFHISACIGVSKAPNDGQYAEDLLKSAGVALFRAKEQGRNIYVHHTGDMGLRVCKLQSLERGLRKALKENELIVHYQPQVDLSTGRILGVEALLRWMRPEEGLISPGDFIPLAEETGLIVPIGHWVLRTACAQNKAWQANGHPPVRMAVNISARQFQQAGFVETVLGVLEETGLDPRWLELEITESSIMKNADATISTLADLKMLGLRLAVDDFGTGYSSLNYLKLFPIDVLKIDRSFIGEITTDANDSAIAGAIVALAKSMKLEVIAEGVETWEQLHFLRELGCNQGQGFYFGRPLPAEAIPPWCVEAQETRSGKCTS